MRFKLASASPLLSRRIGDGVVATTDIQRMMGIIRDTLDADEQIKTTEPRTGDPALLDIQMTSGRTYYLEVTA